MVIRKMPVSYGLELGIKFNKNWIRIKISLFHNFHCKVYWSAQHP